MRKFHFLLSMAAIVLAGCAVGPNYQRPTVQTPSSFRAPTPPASDPASLADLKWFEVFRDEKLQELIRTALEQNFDLRDAVTRVEEARANLGITHSGQLPQVGATGALDVTRLSRNGSIPLPAGFVSNQN